MFKVYETELAGRKLTIETGKFANQANASVTVRYGETVVMTNVAAAKEAQTGVDFFPLSVNYEEKLYAVGRIPGSFNRREGKPADKAVLISRAIDRPIRPLFPHDFRNDVCVTNTVLSMDQDASPEVCANIGTSAALSISDIPWGGPTAAVQVGYVDGQIIINPNEEQRSKSDLQLTVAGTLEKITMIEAGANEIPNDTMLQAIKMAHVEIKKMCEFISNIKAEIGKPKFEYTSFAVDPEFYKSVCDKFETAMYEAVQNNDKEVRNDNVDKVKEQIAIEIISNSLLGKTSELYQELYDEGLLMSSLDADFEFSDEYAHVVIGGESKDPRKVYEKVEEVLKNEIISKEDFERSKKKIYGEYVSEYNDVENIGRMFLADSLRGINSLEYIDKFNKVTLEYVNEILDKLFKQNESVISIVK